MHAISDYNPKLTPAFRQKLANLVFTLRETFDTGYHAGYTDDGYAGNMSSVSDEESSKKDGILLDAMSQLTNGVAFTIVNERVRDSAYHIGRHAGIRDGYIKVSHWMIRVVSKGVIVASYRFETLDDAKRHAKYAIDAMADTDTTVQALIMPVLADGALGGLWQTMHLGQC